MSDVYAPRPGDLLGQDTGHPHDPRTQDHQENTEYAMDAAALIQDELHRIEERAARETSHLLAAQDAFLAAHRLVALLKTHGAAGDLTVTAIYHSRAASIVLYPSKEYTKTLSAIHSSGIEIVGVRRGYANDLSCAFGKAA